MAPHLGRFEVNHPLSPRPTFLGHFVDLIPERPPRPSCAILSCRTRYRPNRSWSATAVVLAAIATIGFKFRRRLDLRLHPVAVATHVNIFAQHEMLMAAFPRPQPPAEDIPI